MVLFGSLTYDPEFFCFCFNLRKGNIFIGFLYIFIFFFLCSFLLWHPCYTNVATKDCPLKVGAWTMLCIINIFNILGVITATGFLYGIFCDIRLHATRFLYILAISGVFIPLVFNTTLVITSIAFEFNDLYPTCYYAPNLGLCLIFTVVFITMTGYIISVVKSYRSGMELDVPKAKCDQNQPAQGS